MNGWSPFILVELVLVFGVVLAWGVNEMRVLRRDTQKRMAREAETAAKAASTDSDTASRGRSH